MATEYACSSSSAFDNEIFFDSDHIDITHVVEIKMEDVQEIDLDDEEDTAVFTEDMAIHLISENGGNPFMIEHDYSLSSCDPFSNENPEVQVVEFKDAASFYEYQHAEIENPGVLEVGKCFTNHEDACRAVKLYGEATSQVFVQAPSCPRTKEGHKLHSKFPYSSVKFLCKHGGVYKPHRPGFVPLKRPNQHSTKTDCPVLIKMKLNLKTSMLEVLQVTEPESHNHPLSEEIYNHYPEARYDLSHSLPSIDFFLRGGVLTSLKAQNPLPFQNKLKYTPGGQVTLVPPPLLARACNGYNHSKKQSIKDCVALFQGRYAEFQDQS